jgi:hypothetical protein
MASISIGDWRATSLEIRMEPYVQVPIKGVPVPSTRMYIFSRLVPTYL